MAPEVSPCHPTPIVTPIIQFLPREPPRSLLANQPPKYKYYQGTKRMMMITKKKLIPILIFTLSGFSILRLLKISTVSLFSSPPAVALPPTHPHTQGPSKSRSISSDSAATLTEKEFRLLSNLISLRAPCNLLIFGLEQKYLNLSRINAGGKTVFLEDNSEKLNKIEANYSNTRIYKVEYQTVAKDAYKLLKYARRNPACGLQHSRSGSLKNSSCPLALTRLPREVYKRKWDMVVVDGPRGDAPDAPGRMATIYTASLIARSGNITDVVVHDVDRMIEKWFAWEFLCDENLVSSKGKLWNFRIIGKSNSTTFCPGCNDFFCVHQQNSMLFEVQYIQAFGCCPLLQADMPSAEARQQCQKMDAKYLQMTGFHYFQGSRVVQIRSSYKGILFQHLKMTSQIQH